MKRTNLALEGKETIGRPQKMMKLCQPVPELDLSTTNQRTSQLLCELSSLCSSVVSLNLSFWPYLTEKDLLVLLGDGPLPNLQRINISHTCVSDSAMNVLATRCPHLLSIDLSGCQEITDVSLSLLAQHCPLLQHIKLSGCPHVSDTGVQLIAQETKHHLLSLDLDECPAITDKTLLFLGYYCANISSLHLKNTRVTAGVLSKLLSSRFKLRELNVQGLPINDNFLFLLSRFQPYLEILDISFCYNITSQGIRKIILDEVFMQEIHLFGLPASITDEAVKCSDSCGNQKLFLFF